MSRNPFAVNYAFFGVKFSVQNFCLCKKMTNMRYGPLHIKMSCLHYLSVYFRICSCIYVNCWIGIRRCLHFELYPLYIYLPQKLSMKMWMTCWSSTSNANQQYVEFKSTLISTKMFRFHFPHNHIHGWNWKILWKHSLLG